MTTEVHNETPTQIVRSKRTVVALDDSGFIANPERAFAFAKTLIAAKLAPKGMDSPEKVLIAIQAGAELGFSVMRSLSAITVINGKAGLMGEAALSRIFESGACSRPPVMTCEGTGEERRGVVRFQRKDMPEAVEVTFSVAEAKRAHLWGKQGPWAEYPDDMLQWRAVARACKRYFGDILNGQTIVEELRDYPTEPREPQAAPTGDDPLLKDAPEAETVRAVEAEVVTENKVSDGGETTSRTASAEPSGTPSTAESAHPPSSAPPIDEQELIAAVEKLENALVSAETVRRIDFIWNDAKKKLLPELGEKEVQRLAKLYEQNRKGLE